VASLKALDMPELPADFKMPELPELPSDLQLPDLSGVGDAGAWSTKKYIIFAF
jgi:hypothetical protein